MQAENGPSLELPVMLALEGGRTVMCILEAYEPRECRFRALVELSLGARVQLVQIQMGSRAAAEHGGAAVPPSFAGIITERTATGPRKNYILKLDGAPEAPPRIVAPPKPVFAPAPLVRSSLRVAVDFPLGYARDGGAIGHGRASNLSEGGIHVVAKDEFSVGTALELTFVLPGTSGREIVVNARVVARHPGAPGTERSYNMAFFGLERSAHERIAAYVKSRSS
jgi:hypothetical protein